MSGAHSLVAQLVDVDARRVADARLLGDAECEPRAHRRTHRGRRALKYDGGRPPGKTEASCIIKQVIPAKRQRRACRAPGNVMSKRCFRARTNMEVWER